VKRYNVNQLLIVDQKIAGAYDKRIDAYVEGANNYGFVNFSLQRCSPGERDTVLRLYGPCYRINPTPAICSQERSLCYPLTVSRSPYRATV
jgi:hypothetical protein